MPASTKSNRRRLAHLRVSQKVYFAFACVLIVTVILGGFAMDRLDRINGEAAEIRERWLPTTRALDELSFQFMRFRMIEAALLLAPPDGKLGETKTLETIKGRIDKVFSTTLADARSTLERQEIGALSARWRAYLELDRSFKTAVLGADASSATDLYRGPMRELSHTIQDDVGKSVSENVQNADAAADRGAAIGKAAHIWIIVAVSMAGLLCLVIGWLLIRGIARPIGALTKAMTALANADLEADIPDVDLGNEIGAMARSVLVFKLNGRERARLESEAEANRIAADDERARSAAERAQAAREQAQAIQRLGEGLQSLARGDLTNRLADGFSGKYSRIRDDFNEAMARLQTTLTAVVEACQTIQTGVQQITVASADLSRRTEQQAATLDQSTIALKDLAGAVDDTADRSIKTKDIISTAKIDTGGSVDVVRQTIDLIMRIMSSSQRIGTIVGVIDEIAFQTNLLALNAGVEAARAGEAGRGFAVVATEVRALAQRSAEAAKEIKQLISRLSDDVSDGVKLVGETGRAFDRINSQISVIDGGIADIAGQAVNQSSLLNLVNTAVGELDQSTQQNAAMAEQATAACQSLAQQAERLTQMVGQFAIGKRNVSEQSEFGAETRNRNPARNSVAA